LIVMEKNFRTFRLLENPIELKLRGKVREQLFEIIPPHKRFA
jgi:hypothetical protein